jgi:uncharacterized phiE125 gp8 family phage protein
MSLVILTPPAIEPLTIAEVITHLRLDSTNLEPAPGAPVVALSNVGAGNVTSGAHRYCLTFVTADGETSAGDASASVTTSGANGQVDVTLPLGGSFVTARRVYRTLAGGSTFFLVATINDNSTATYRDNIADAGLGQQVPSANTTQDPYLKGLIRSAREVAETSLNRALISQQWRKKLDCFPSQSTQWINLEKPTLLSVDAFQYRDYTGTWVAMDPTLYETDVEAFPGRVIKKFTRVWPPTLPQPGVIRIDFTCGYGATASTIPEAIKNGMKLVIGELYENREAVIEMRGSLIKMPALERLWGPHRYAEAH